MCAICIPGKRPCGPKLRVMFKCLLVADPGHCSTLYTFHYLDFQALLSHTTVNREYFIVKIILDSLVCAKIYAQC